MDALIFLAIILPPALGYGLGSAAAPVIGWSTDRGGRLGTTLGVLATVALFALAVSHGPR